MSIKKNTSNDGKTIFLSISGRFDYKIIKDFRESFSNDKDQEGMTYFINLNDVSYMDSSALGILLVLRQHANNNKGKVTIDRPSEQVSQVLKVANFEKLFTINDANEKSSYLELAQ